MTALSAGTLDRLILIERPDVDDTFRGAGAGQWIPVDQVWADVQDSLPSKGEVGGGATMLTRPARVRMRYRDDIDSTMRFVDGDRVLVITAGPAVIGRRAGLEFMTAEYVPGGNAA